MLVLIRSVKTVHREQAQRELNPAIVLLDAIALGNGQDKRTGCVRRIIDRRGKNENLGARPRVRQDRNATAGVRPYVTHKAALSYRVSTSVGHALSVERSFGTDLTKRSRSIKAVLSAVPADARCHSQRQIRALDPLASCFHLYTLLH
jgi:hypothetical protein